ncbi:MAG: VOC family protein [Planctomycetota bacterium]
MPVEKITPILNVSSIAESFAWLEHFGWQRTFCWNQGGLIGEGADCPTANEHGPADFAGMCQGTTTLFLCEGGQGPPLTSAPANGERTGVWMTWWVSSKAEVDELHEIAIRHGCDVTWPPTDEPWGVREFHLRHPDGHLFRVSCGLD